MCARARARACVRVRMCVCVRVRMCEHLQHRLSKYCCVIVDNYIHKTISQDVEILGSLLR